jgi:hypothetical protein
VAGNAAASVQSSNTGSTAIANTVNGTMDNTVGSLALSGDASVIGNTLAGGATTGDAAAMATVANLLQSSSNIFGTGGTIAFVSNINGDVNGDLLLDPSQINTINSSVTPPSGDIQVNASNDVTAQMNNDITVGATSGDATVAKNTSAGDATTGTATAVANVMNLINSAVNAGQSFIGVVNINGNFNGDILLPQNFIDQLLASNVPANSTTQQSGTTSTSLNNIVTAGIQNNVTTAAASGNAAVAQNTKAGDATSGQATTNVTILNLTGSNVIGSNDLLVFVNVLGHWVGMIVNAPAGATSASLGGGITANNTAAIDNSFNAGITNNIAANAQSGNATIGQNTKAGNATSGDAKAAVNLLNVANSNLSLSNWFGILFINVFGNWSGSFGVNTSAGDPVLPAPTPRTDTAKPAVASTPPATTISHPFASFISHDSGAPSSSSDIFSPPIVTLASVLGTQTTKNVPKDLPTPDNATHASYLIPAIGIGIAAAMLIGERVVTLRNKR